MTRTQAHILKHFQSSWVLTKIMQWEEEMHLTTNYHTHGFHIGFKRPSHFWNDSKSLYFHRFLPHTFLTSLDLAFAHLDFHRTHPPLSAQSMLFTFQRLDAIWFPPQGLIWLISSEFIVPSSSFPWQSLYLAN